MVISWERAVTVDFPLCCFNYSAVRVPFPFGVWGRMMWNSIVPIPDHCLFIYLLLLKYGFTVAENGRPSV